MRSVECHSNCPPDLSTFYYPGKTDSEALPEFRHGLIPAFELRLAQGEHDFSRLTEFLWKISAKSAYLAWQW